MLLALAIASLIAAALPAGIFLANLRLYTPPPNRGPEPLPKISILIPARNEETTIAACVKSALASAGAPVEIIVMDDNSTDRTAALVRNLIQELIAAHPHARIRLEQAPPLPPGWNGKQHACWHLAHAANGDILCFLDADVRLAPDCAARMASFLEHTGSALVSGFPRQVTVTWLEQLLLPLIHFVLLGFLPLFQARKTNHPGYAAGCGQFLMVRRSAYFAAGGHSAIRTSMHDGIKLPRLCRQHGLRTDLADITQLATCRMYTSARQVWSGLAKNATEGMASPPAILPATLFLILGQIAPFLLLRLAVTHRLSSTATACTLVAVLCAWFPRFVAIRRFHQAALGAFLHPLGILVLFLLQWVSFFRNLAGAPVTWKNRAYTPN